MGLSNALAADKVTTKSVQAKTPIIYGDKSLVGKSLGAKQTILNAKTTGKKKVGFVSNSETIGQEGGIPGTCGAGLSTGAHLHFEVRRNGSAVNPRDYIGSVLSWPMANFQVTQEFGPADWTPWYTYHTGIDLAANYGTSVHAAGRGTIIFNGISGGYGHLIIIDHGGGLRTYYGHLICS